MSARLSVDNLAEGVLAGRAGSLARAISLIESESPAAQELLRAVYPRTGRAHVVGVTGAPGAGKSTLVNALVRTIREAGDTVGVIAVDPTSPFTGGAVLGDRVRMTGHSGDAGVFVRSMATRGNLGGLTRATYDTVSLLDAAGFGIVLVETVGVGQDEVDVVHIADTSIVVFVPGTGDDVQALKAGIMEIADVFVVNKADRDGADQLVQAIRGALSLVEDGESTRVRPGVLKTVATTGEGIPELWAALQSRRTGTSQDEGRRRAREESRLRALVSARFWSRFEQAIPAAEIARMLDDLGARRIDPYTAARQLFDRVLDRKAEL